MQFKTTQDCLTNIPRNLHQLQIFVSTLLKNKFSGHLLPCTDTLVQWPMNQSLCFQNNLSFPLEEMKASTQQKLNRVFKNYFRSNWNIPHCYCASVCFSVQINKCTGTSMKDLNMIYAALTQMLKETEKIITYQVVVAINYSQLLKPTVDV